MKRLHAAPAGMAILVAVALAGCNSSSSVTGSNGTSTNGSSSASGTAISAIGAATTNLQAADSLAHGPCMAVGFPLEIPAGCGWDAGTSSFVCGPDSRPDGTSGTRSYQFLDASGNAQGAYDSVTTASIVFASHLTGTRTLPNGVTRMDDALNLVESGLAGSETTRTWNGSGSSTHSDSMLTLAGVTVVVHSVSSTLVDGVVVPKPWHRDSWPLSGTIRTHLVMSGSRTLDQQSTLRFNGTQYATLAVGDSMFSIDLARPPHGDGPDGGPGVGSGGGGDPGHGGPPGGGPPSGGPPGGGPPGGGAGRGGH